MKNNKKSVKIQTKGFSTHKQGDEPKDNQDAFSISQLITSRIDPSPPEIPLSPDPLILQDSILI